MDENAIWEKFALQFQVNPCKIKLLPHNVKKIARSCVWVCTMLKEVQWRPPIQIKIEPLERLPSLEDLCTKFKKMMIEATNNCCSHQTSLSILFYSKTYL